MTYSDFQVLVRNNAKWFQGVNPETAESVGAAELQLGVELPRSLKWLLIEWGYSTVCAVDSLDEAVETTLRARTVLGLPRQLVILNDWQDAGAVFFDTTTPNAEGEYPVYWAGAHNLYRLADGEAMDTDVDVFDGYAAWAASRLEAEKAE